jgi:hypothetical protein
MIDRGAAEGQQFTERLSGDRAQRARREWKLTLPAAAYAGRYCNGEFGTIVLSLRGERINVRMGAMSAAATPMTEPDSMRVELIPNEGMPLQFLTEGNRAIALRAFGTSFGRCG